MHRADMGRSIRSALVDEACDEAPIEELILHDGEPILWQRGVGRCADPRAETAVDPDLGPHSFARGCNVGMDQAFVEVRITTLRRSASGADDRNRADRDEA